MGPSKKGNRKLKQAVILYLPVDPELKELIAKAACEEGMSMNEWVAQIVANHLDRPDLAGIPRKPFGRPRKELSAK